MSIGQSPAKIYLSAQRGVVKGHIAQTCSTFNYGQYYNEHKQGVGALYTCNDVVLAEGGNTLQHARHTGFNIIIPITGVVNYADYSCNIEAGAGEVLLIPVQADAGFTVNNMDADNQANFILLQIQDNDIAGKKPACTMFDLDATADKMITIDQGANSFGISIGRFKGRSEALYHLHADTLAVFAFVIAGAFEVQNRLLHERDALALWDITTVDAEALSNNAVLLLIEIK